MLQTRNRLVMVRGPLLRDRIESYPRFQKNCLVKVCLIGPKRLKIGPIKVSQALVKCSRAEQYDFQVISPVPEPSDP